MTRARLIRRFVLLLAFVPVVATGSPLGALGGLSLPLSNNDGTPAKGVTKATTSRPIGQTPPAGRIKAKQAPPAKPRVVAVPSAGRARTVRSAAARHAFEVQTGYPDGRPGYIIDHIVPLACGGTDTPANMQWQTAAEASAKDRVQRAGCR